MADVWHRQLFLHIKPPWGIIPRILKEIIDEKSRAVIVAPVAVGLVVAHTGVPWTMPAVHHLMKPSQGSGWPTDTSTEMTHAGTLACRKPGGKSSGTRCHLLKYAERNLNQAKREKVQAEVLGGALTAPWSRTMYEIFFPGEFYEKLHCDFLHLLYFHELRTDQVVALCIHPTCRYVRFLYQMVNGASSM